MSRYYEPGIGTGRIGKSRIEGRVMPFNFCLLCDGLFHYYKRMDEGAIKYKCLCRGVIEKTVELPEWCLDANGHQAWDGTPC